MSTARAKLLPLGPKPEDAILEAVAFMREGGLVIYPTETCYALGADALNPDAVREVYEVKKRPFSAPLPVVVADEGMWRSYVEFTPAASTLIKKFSAGPLTLVLSKKPLVPDLLNPCALAARISSHPVPSTISRLLGGPVVSTSANAHGGAEPYTVTEALDSLPSFEGIALDAGQLPRRPVSTVVDLTVRPYRIQRAHPQGALKTETIREAMRGMD